MEGNAVMAIKTALETKIAIPRAEKAEDVGVSSKAVLEFLTEIENEGFEVHSFMLIRNSMVAAECFRSPFSPERPHQMYSISKTITATAVGFAVNEGLLSLDTRIADVFPDYCENIHDEFLDKLCVRHLLTMTSGKKINVLHNKGKIDWIEDYLNSKWYAEPGKEFLYVNENIYMLSAILTRVTGMSVCDYLYTRLFKPLGIEYPYWETDRNGIEAGGWGLYLKTEDLAKIMLCYLNEGKYFDKQIIPEDWAKEASNKLVDNSNNADADFAVGYGYCLWQNAAVPNSFRADGMFSQFAFALRDYDAVFVITSAVANEQQMLDKIWEHLTGFFIEAENPNVEETYIPNLRQILSASAIDFPQESKKSPIETFIEDRRIKVRKKILLNLTGFPVSILPLAITYMTTDRAGNIDDIMFRFSKNECSMKWREGDEDNTVICGMNGHFRYGTIRLGQIDYTVCCNAEWLSEQELMINIRPINTVAKRLLRFNFNANGRVKILPRSTPTVKDISNYLKTSAVSMIFTNKKLGSLFGNVTRLFPMLLEPELKGKMLPYLGR